MIEENKLRQHVGTKDPFKVPEGYFDTFADRLQSRIDQMPKAEKKPTKRVHLVPKAWFAAAASIVIVASVGLSVMLPKWKTGQADINHLANTELAGTSESDASAMEEAYYFDEFDYAMIDNNEIAYYLTEN